MDGDEASAVRVTVRGQVQGVWYRNWTVENAMALGLSGWVRNRGDGSVEAVFAGPQASIETMIARCHIGPPAAHVEAVEQHLAAMPANAGFQQLPTV